MLLDYCSQAIYASAQISITTGNKGVVWLEAVQHDFMPRKKLSMNAGEAFS